MSRIRFMAIVATVLFVSTGFSRAQQKEEELKPSVAGDIKQKEKKKSLAPVELGELVVTPGRIEEPIADITESVTVITARQIEESAAMDVTEALRIVPGLSLRQQGGLGGTSIPYLRGTLGTQTVVLIDGIQVNDPTLGYQFDFDDLDTANIERIEVIRGVEAAMYGPGAVGGVINIITKRGRGEPRNLARAIGGSFGTGYTQLGSLGEKNGFSHAFAISQLTTDNARKNNQSDKTTLSGRMRYKLDDHRTVDIFTRCITSRHEEPFEFFPEDPFVPAPAYIELDPNIVRRQDQSVLGGKFTHKINEALSWDAFLSFYDSVSRFLNDDDDGSGTPEFRFTAEASVITGRVQAVLNLDKEKEEDREEDGKKKKTKSRIIAGGEWTWEDTLTASSFGLTPDRVQNRAGYVQGRVKLHKKILVSAGMRVDGHSTYGTNQSPAAGVKIETWKGGAVRSSWSRAFRPPSHIELTDPWYGNPDLKKERRNGFDAGILQKLFSKKLKAEITYFQTKIDDNIGYDFSTFRMENFNTHAEGIELGASYVPNRDFAFDLSYTRVATRDLMKHLPLAGRSPNFGAFKITRRFGKLAVTLTGYFSEKVPPERVLDEKGRPQKNAGKVDLVNLAFLYKLSGESKLVFKLTNILDRRYRESERAPRAPGLGLFVGVSSEF